METKIIVISLVILASGCLHASSPDTGSSQETMDETSQPTELPGSDSNTVYLTSSGFTPSTLTIQQGETVTWINNASRDMWVGSDRHPTHTDYSGSTLREHCQNGDQNTVAFDQCSTGDRFSFTFDKTGEWGYHNHESAGQVGTILVE